MIANDLPNKSTRQKPRKSSTNTRALSTRIKNIQKEMNPYIHLTGGTAVGTTVTTYIDRKSSTVFQNTNGFNTVTAADLSLALPDGARILGMKIMNITGRELTVTIPADSALVTNKGPTDAPNKLMKMVAFAPLSRFPSLKVDIPDVLANTIDTGGTLAQSLFSVFGTPGGTDKCVVRFHYKQAI